MQRYNTKPSVTYLSCKCAFTQLMVLWILGLCGPLTAAEEELVDSHAALSFDIPPEFNLIETFLSSSGDLIHSSKRWNYQIQGPSGMNKSSSPQALNPVYDVAFTRGNQIIASVIVEDAGGIINDNAQLDRAVRRQFENQPGQELTPSEDRKSGGLTGTMFTRIATFQNIKFISLHWNYCHKGRCYQINVFGPILQSDYVKSSFDAFVDSFEIVDLDVAHELTYNDEGTGLSILLPDKLWTVAENLGEYKDYFQFGFVDTANSAMLFNRMPHMGIDVPNEIITKLQLGVFGIDNNIQLKRRQVDTEAGTVHIQTFELSNATITESWCLWHIKQEGQIISGAGWCQEEDVLPLLEKMCVNVKTPKAKSPLNGHQLAVASKTMAGLGLISSGNNQIRLAIDCFEACIEMNNLADAYLYLIQLYDRQMDMDKAFEVVTRGLKSHPDNQTMQAWHCITLASTKQFDAAVEQAQRLITSGYTDINFVDRLFLCFYDADKKPKAIALLASVLEQAQDPYVVKLYVQSLADSKHIAEAQEQLEKFKTALGDRQLAVLRSYIHRCNEDPEAARAALDTLHASHGEQLDDLIEYARVEMSVGDYKQARHYAEKAYALDNNNKDVQDILLYIKALLGEGSHVGITEKIDPVQVPPGALKNTEIGDIDEEGYYLKRVVMAINFDPGVDLRYTHINHYHVLDVNGLRQLSNLEVDYDPLSESISINRIVVKDAQGAVRWTGKPGSYYQLDKNEEGMAHFEKTVHVPVEGLFVGADIEFEYTILKRVAPEKMPFEYWTPRLGRYVHESLLWIKSPAGSIAFDNPGKLEQEQLEAGVVYRAHRLNAVTFEDSMTDWVKELPILIFGSSQNKWGAIAKEYLDDLEEYVKDTAPIDMLDLSSSDLKSCYKQLQHSMSYHAIEFGYRARIPQKITHIQKSRKGDCKDHSLLLYHMLKRKGLNPHLALVSKWDYVSNVVPSLDQFNHMIVVLRNENGETIYLDATEKGTPLGARCAPGLLGKYCLILDGSDAPPQLITDQTSRHYLERDSSVTIHADGSAAVQDKLTFHGILADNVRNSLAPIHAEYRRLSIERMLSNGFMHVQEVTFSGLQNYDGPVTLDLTYQVSGVMVQGEDQMMGRYLANWASYLFKIHSTNKRKFSFQHLTEVQLVWETAITCPDGWQWHAVEDEPLADIYFDFQQKREIQGKVLRLTGKAARKAGKHPAASYPDFLKSGQATLLKCYGPLILKK